MADFEEKGQDPAFRPEDLGQAWFDLPGLDERGAGGRLVIAPARVTRSDLDFNYEVVLAAIQHLGAKPSVDGLTGWNMTDEVVAFFGLSRPRGKAPVNRNMHAIRLDALL